MDETEKIKELWDAGREAEIKWPSLWRAWMEMSIDLFYSGHETRDEMVDKLAIIFNASIRDQKIEQRLGEFWDSFGDFRSRPNY